MITAFKTLACAASAATLATTVPAMAMPAAPPASQALIVKASSWATRAEGRRHTYPDAYGYGYAPGAYGGYRGWAYDGYAEPYNGYGRAAVPDYDYGDDDDAYGY